MYLNVIPGWLKSLLISSCLCLLVWSMLDKEPSSGKGEQRVLLAPPGADLDNGLTGKVQNNIRQIASNPLEKPPHAGEGAAVVRDNPENYYRDED